MLMCFVLVVLCLEGAVVCWFRWFGGSGSFLVFDLFLLPEMGKEHGVKGAWG